MRGWTRGLILAAALTLPLSACDDNDTIGPDSDGDVDFTLLLTDAPGDVEAAVLTVSQIYLQRGDTPENEGDGVVEGEVGEEVDGRVVLVDDPFTVDLVTLANDVETLLDDADIPAGRYAQLRLVVDGGYVAVENDDGGLDVYVSDDFEPIASGGIDFDPEVYLAGRVNADDEPMDVDILGDLQMPSFAQSGLKLNFNGLEGGDLDLDDDTVLLLDFDVSESFGHQAGQSGKWVMHPVIRADLIDDRDALATSLEVGIDLGTGIDLPVLAGVAVSLDQFHARLLDAEGDLESDVAFTSDDGSTDFSAEFDAILVDDGPYSLVLTGPAGISFTTDPIATVADPFDLDLTAGASNEVAFTITAADLVP